MYRGLGIYLLPGCVGTSQHQLHTVEKETLDGQLLASTTVPDGLLLSQSQVPGDLIILPGHTWSL